MCADQAVEGSADEGHGGIFEIGGLDVWRAEIEVGAMVAKSTRQQPFGSRVTGERADDFDIGLVLQETQRLVGRLTAIGLGRRGEVRRDYGNLQIALSIAFQAIWLPLGALSAGRKAEMTLGSAGRTACATKIKRALANRKIKGVALG